VTLPSTANPTVFFAPSITVPAATLAAKPVRKQTKIRKKVEQVFAILSIK